MCQEIATVYLINKYTEKFKVEPQAGAFWFLSATGEHPLPQGFIPRWGKEIVNP